MLKRFLMLMLAGMLLATCSLPEPSDIVPPIPIVIYPFAGAVVSEDFDVVVEVADESDLEVVWVYLDGELIGEDREPPYRVPVQVEDYRDNLSHVVQVGARDEDDNEGFSLPVTFIVADSEDNIPPTVSILNPQPGQRVEKTVRIVALADDERSVKKVAFFVDGDSVGVSESEPYEYFWDTSQYADSSNHTIYAKAFDGGNNEAYSPVITVVVFPSLDNVPPAATITYPLSGQVVFDTVNVTVEASDNKGIARVDYLVDGMLQYSDDEAPYVYPWDTAPYSNNSTHSIYAKAYDTNSNVTTTELITVTVSKNSSDDVVPPSVLVLYPVSGSTVSGIVPVAADISDNRGVAYVEFYVDGVLASTDIDGPTWGFNWNTAGYADGGTHSLFVKAYDEAGNVGTSALIVVTIPSP